MLLSLDRRLWFGDDQNNMTRIVNGRSTMARGTVKWFNPTKGYGFIQPQAGGRDAFVHISAVERARD